MSGLLIGISNAIRGELFGSTLPPVVNTVTGTYISSRLVSATNPNAFGDIQYRINGGAWITGSSVLITESSTIDWRIAGVGVNPSPMVSILVTIQCAAPVISPAGGNITNIAPITITTTTGGASIYYTTNGTEPTESSTLYTAPFTLLSSGEVRAKVFKSGTLASSTTSAVFNVVPANFWLHANGTSAARAYASDNQASSWYEVQPMGNTNQPWTQPITRQLQFGILGFSPGSYSLNYYRTLNGGQTWSQIAFPAGVNGASSIKVAGESNRLVACFQLNSTTTRIYISNDLGVTWQDSNCPITSNGTVRDCFDISADGQVIVVGGSATTNAGAGIFTTGGVYISTDGGATWTTRTFTQVAGSSTVSVVSVRINNNGDRIYVMGGNIASTGNENLRLSTNFGVSFADTANPAASIFEGIGFDISRDGRTVYLSARNGTPVLMYRSINSGTSWTPLTATPLLLTQQSYVSVNRENPNIVYVSSLFMTSPGGVISFDGGSTWQNINLPFATAGARRVNVNY